MRSYGNTLGTITRNNRIKIRQRDDYITYTNEFNAAQTGAVIITPTAGKKIVVKEMAITTDATAGAIYLKWGTSASIIAAVYATKFNSISMPNMSNGQGVADETIKITTTTNTDNVFVAISYVEE